MVKEPAYCAAYDGLGVPVDVPGKSKPRSDVVLIARITLRYVKRILSDLEIADREGDAGQRIGERRRCKLARIFIVITNAVIDSEAVGDLPRILSEDRYRLVVQRAERISKALNEHARIAKAVRLDGRDRRTPSEAL